MLADSPQNTTAFPHWEAQPENVGLNCRVSKTFFRVGHRAISIGAPKLDDLHTNSRMHFLDIPVTTVSLVQ